MLIRFHTALRRARASRSDDRGASLILVIGLMGVGFIIAAIIAASVLFTVRHTTQARGNVDSFAAAEAGRDVAMATMAKSFDGCTDPHYPDSTDPEVDYSGVTVYAVSTSDPPTSAEGLSPKCPEQDATYVVVKSTGTSELGGTVTIHTVYSVEAYADRVAGGGLGFIDQDYTAIGVTYDGDLIIRRGDFTCGALGKSTTIKGSVFVVDGKMGVPASISSSSDCVVQGDVVTSKGVTTGSCFRIFISTQCFGADLKVGGRIKTTGDITVVGSLAVAKSIETSSTIESAERLIGSSSIQSTSGGISAGAIKATSGSITAAQGVMSATSISGGGTVKGATVSAMTTIDGTVTSTVGAIRAGGNVNGAIDAKTDITSSGGSVATAKNMLKAGGAIIANYDISVTDASGAIDAKGNVEAGRNIALKGKVTASNVLATGSINTSHDCTISNDLHAGGTVKFEQGSGRTCTVTKAIRAGAGQSTLMTSGNYARVAADSAQTKGTWQNNNNYYAKLTKKDRTTASTNGTYGSPTIATPPAVGPVVFKLTDPDDKWRSFADLELRTRWVDLGVKTRWNGYPPAVVLAGDTCSKTEVERLLAATDGKVVIDAATNCGDFNLGSLSDRVKLGRDAVLLVKNVTLRFVRFEADNLPAPTAEVPHPVRQFLVVQVDDDLTLERPPDDPTGDYQPRPDCSAGQRDISVSFAGLTWDPNVHALLYSPCGSASTKVLSTWHGHLYVAKDTGEDTPEETNIFTNLKCERIYIEGTVDLPCRVSEFGEMGEHEEDFIRIGDMLSQTEG